MTHAEKCPVCGGRGKVDRTPTSTAIIMETCNGCGGKGWVKV